MFPQKFTHWLTVLPEYRIPFILLLAFVPFSVAEEAASSNETEPGKLGAAAVLPPLANSQPVPAFAQLTGNEEADHNVRDEADPQQRSGANGRSGQSVFDAGRVRIGPLVPFNQGLSSAAAARFGVPPNGALRAGGTNNAGIAGGSRAKNSRGQRQNAKNGLQPGPGTTNAILTGRNAGGGLFRRRFNTILGGTESKTDEDIGRKTEEEEAIIEEGQKEAKTEEEAEEEAEELGKTTKRKKRIGSGGAPLEVRVSGGRVLLDGRKDPTTEEQEQRPECEDKAENCAENAAFCGQSPYQQLMADNCAKTCRTCKQRRLLKIPPGLIIPPGEPKVWKGSSDDEDGDEVEKSKQCRDSSARCQFWAQRGFCASRLFHSELKQRFCARSCGLCGAEKLDKFGTKGGGVPEAEESSSSAEE